MEKSTFVKPTIVPTVQIATPIAPFPEYENRSSNKRLIPQYREVPPEDKSPIDWVNPPLLLNWQMDNILRWGTLIDIVIYEYNYPPEYQMLVLGIIAQESQGDENIVCMPWRDEICGIGLMGVTPAAWTNTAAALENPRINISVGTWIFDVAMRRAIRDFNFKPGREATRAALAAYNCGWVSLLDERCASFGGWTYADKVLNYWIPLLEERIGELK